MASSDGTRPETPGIRPPSDGAWIVVLVEALILAAGHQPARSLELVEAALECGGVPVAPALAAALLTARVALSEAAGEPLATLRARQALEAAMRAAGPHAWIATLERARAERRAGEVRSAAELLRAVTHDFRLAAVELGPVLEPLAREIAREVARLHGGRRPVTPAGQATRVVSGSLDEPEVLLLFVDCCQRMVDARDRRAAERAAFDGAIALAFADRALLVVVRDDGLSFPLVHADGRALLSSSRGPVVRTLVREAQARDAARFLFDEQDGPALIAALPLSTRGRVTQVVYLESDHPSAGRARRCQLLELFAAQAANRLATVGDEPAEAAEAAPSGATHHRFRTSFERRARLFELVGASDAMQEVYRQLETVVATTAPLLVVGETGTGKELVARFVHEKGSRGDRPFVAVNCAAVAESLLESELFGYEKGAFTGAESSRAGLFEAADGGTLFLDEIGEMSPRMQASLLRVLQSGEIQRVGAAETRKVDVRVIAATHRDLQAMVAARAFREDLLFRIDVLRVEVPPLRARIEDLAPLMAEFFARHAEDRPIPTIRPDAMRRLLAWRWPGNVRELENLVQRLLMFGVAEIDEKHLPPEMITGSVAERRGAGRLVSLERRAITDALRAAGGNRAKAARLLGIDRRTLFRKLKQYRGGS